MTDETLDHAKYWTTLGMVLGYNELAKMAPDLEDKVYFRFARDVALMDHVACGGKPDMFPTEEAVIEIEVDREMPHIVFRERDVQLMRDYIAKYDLEHNSV